MCVSGEKGLGETRVAFHHARLWSRDGCGTPLLSIGSTQAWLFGCLNRDEKVSVVQRSLCRFQVVLTLSHVALWRQNRTFRRSW